MTLSTARTYLSPYIDNGSCSTINAVRDRINEGQRRIFHAGNFLGTVKRWGVTVATDGTFTIPVGCESVIRISELPATLLHSTNGTVVASDAYAFVFDSPSLLRFTMTSPGQFKILGPYPTAVDVMGKVDYVDAAVNTDNLVIDDKDALKFMMLGITHENNNAPELANELIQKALTHMQMKTDTAVETAKASLYMNMLSTCPPNTRGYARAKVALADSGGDRVRDAQVAEYLDDAEQRIMQLTQMWHSYLCKSIGGYFSVPHEIETMLRCDVNGCPTHLSGPTAEFIEAGLGYAEKPYPGYSGVKVVYRGDFALQADMPYESVLTIRSGGICRGIAITIAGKNENMEAISETVTMDGGSSTETTLSYAMVDSITADPRDSWLSFSVGDTEVAFMQAHETDSKRARYSMPSSAECASSVVRILGRPRWIPKLRDSQRMQVDNVQALVLMCGAIRLERAGKLQESELLQAKAIALVESALRNKNAGHSVKVDRGPLSSSLARVRRHR